MSKTEFLNFVEIGDTGKTKVYRVANLNGITLGEIRWFGNWRKYVFYTVPDTLYDSKCLNSISRFINQLMIARNNARTSS
jgi:hypothetical protein